MSYQNFWIYLLGGDCSPEAENVVGNKTYIRCRQGNEGGFTEGRERFQSILFVFDMLAFFSKPISQHLELFWKTNFNRKGAPKGIVFEPTLSRPTQAVQMFLASWQHSE